MVNHLVAMDLVSAALIGDGPMPKRRRRHRPPSTGSPGSLDDAIHVVSASKPVPARRAPGFVAPTCKAPFDTSGESMIVR